MTEKEKDKLCHDLVKKQYLFSKKLAMELNGREENVKMEKSIIEESIKRTEKIKNYYFFILIIIKIVL